MFYIASKRIVEELLTENNPKLPLVKKPESMIADLYKLICGYITESVYSDYLRYKNDNKLDAKNAEQRYIDEVINADNYSEYLFRQFPVLQTIVSRAFLNYISYTNEIIDCYHKDRVQIANTWKCDMGEIEEISIGKGDTHSGRSVAILRMTNGRLVFKPHSLDADIFFYKLLVSIADELSTEIFVPKMLSLHEYSWQEYIPYTECSCDAEAERFFYRAGLYQWVFYMLSSVDMHYENLICYREHPVFIDLETLISGSISALEYCEEKSLQSSVLMTGMLPGLKGVQNVIDMNMSALFTGHSKSKKHFSSVIQRDDNNQWTMKKLAAVTSPMHNIVKVNGVEVSAHQYEVFFTNGFRDAAKAFIHHRSRFLCVIDELKEMNVRMRKILRPTIVYGKFLAAGLHPQSLVSDNCYRAVFEILRKNFTIGAFGYLRVNYEIDELMNGNIPSFEIFSNSKDLYAGGQLLCQDYLYETPHSLVRKKCAAIDESIVEYQVRLIRMAFVSQDASDDLLYTVESDAKTACDMDYVHRIADELVNALIPAPGGGYAMIALHTDAENESFVIHTGDSELYHFGGAIWFLYAYGRKYNSKYAEYAEDLLSLLVSKYEYDCSTGSSKNYSVYSGCGALAYISYNMFLMSGDDKFFETAIQIIQNGLEQIANDEINFDYVGGDLSFVYLACKILSHHSDLIQRLTLPIERIKEKLLSRHCVLSNDGLAHGEAGLLTALAAMSKVSNECESTVSQLTNKLQSVFDEVESNTWCRGKTGIAVALTDAGVSASELRYPFVTKDYAMSRGNMCLCHGLMGEVDIELSLFPDHKQRLLDAVSMFDFNTLKVFRNSEYCYESFMLGETGIAYTLLRLMQDDLPSLLLLDLYEG